MSGPAWTWRHAILEAELPATTKHVLLTISCFMKDVGEGCYRTTKELAQFTGLSERAVCTHIENAVKLGWLKKSRHGFRGQKWMRHEYEPLRPKGTEPGSTASKKALNGMQEGAEPDDKKALNQVQRDKNISRNISESSPVAQSRDGGEFYNLWNEWPKASRPHDRSYAEKLFVRLTPEDRGLAVALANCYRVAQMHRGGFAAMILYLRDRQFLEFEGAPVIDSDGYFVIRPDREEWTAWLEHYRAKCSEAIFTSLQKRGFLLTRARWPVETIPANDSDRNGAATPSLARHNATRQTPFLNPGDITEERKGRALRCEPPPVFRRPQLLRGWGHGDGEENIEQRSAARARRCGTGTAADANHYSKPRPKKPKPRAGEITYEHAKPSGRMGCRHQA